MGKEQDGKMIIDGRALAQELNLQTQSRVNQLSVRPLLIDVVVGNDPASLSYVGIKERTAKKYGLAFESKYLPELSTTEDVVKVIEELIERPELTGLIVQLPLPKHLDQQKIVEAIPENVDVDLLNPQSVEKFYNGDVIDDSQLIPPTAAAILHIIDSLPEPWPQKKFLVVGRGELVGKPITHLLRQRGYNVDVAHTQTPNTAQLLSNADCIISGVGKPNFITGDQIKDDVIIIDAGTSEAPDMPAGGTIVGDVDFASCEPKAKYITPVPRGVGPLTVAKLLENVVKVAELSQK